VVEPAWRYPWPTPGAGDGDVEILKPMRLQRLSLSLFGAIAAASVVLAVAAVWLFLTNPVTVATAVNEGDVSPLIRDLADALFTALRGLLKYL
jgi:hypothetical protein